MQTPVSLAVECGRKYFVFPFESQESWKNLAVRFFFWIYIPPLELSDIQVKVQLIRF